MAERCYDVACVFQSSLVATHHVRSAAHAGRRRPVSRPAPRRAEHPRRAATRDPRHTRYGRELPGHAGVASLERPLKALGLDRAQSRPCPADRGVCAPARRRCPGGGSRGRDPRLRRAPAPPPPPPPLQPPPPPSPPPPH